MRALPRWRRVGCALTGIAAAALLLHAQLAAALVTRGDDALGTGDLVTAVRAYERALWLDRGSTVAADRLAFFLAIRHDAPDAQLAIRIATSGLSAAPNSSELLADRGLAEMQLHAWVSAARDFARAGALGDDPRYARFAARMRTHA